MPAPLVARHPIRSGGVTGSETVRDDEVAVYVRGVYAGRLRRATPGWMCDQELHDRIPWPRGARLYFTTADAAVATLRRRLQDAEREARWQAHRRAERAGREIWREYVDAQGRAHPVAVATPDPDPETPTCA